MNYEIKKGATLNTNYSGAINTNQGSQCGIAKLPIGQKVLQDLYHIADRAEDVLNKANTIFSPITREENSLNNDSDPQEYYPSYFSDMRNCNERLSLMLTRLELLLARVEL